MLIKAGQKQTKKEIRKIPVRRISDSIMLYSLHRKGQILRAKCPTLKWQYVFQKTSLCRVVEALSWQTEEFLK